MEWDGMGFFLKFPSLPFIRENNLLKRNFSLFSFSLGARMSH